MSRSDSQRLTLTISIALLLFLNILGRADDSTLTAAAATGSSLTESDYQLTLNVSPDGNDTASGLDDAPLKTVSHAVELGSKSSDQGKNVKILIRAGVYRERVALHKQTAEHPGLLCLEGVGDAVLSGADLWQKGWERFYVTQEEWKWYAGDKRFEGARIYKHDWPYAWDDCENPWGSAEIILDPIVKRPEQLFMNGKPLRLVLNFSDLQEGTFCVNREVKKIYLWPPAGLEPQTALTEVSVRDNVLDTGGRTALLFRHLTFRQARAATYRNGLLVNSSTNVLVDGCRFEWNGWNGFGCCFARDVTLRKCVAQDNGIGGMGAYVARNLLIEDCVDADNNWRGLRGGFVNWGSGSKYMSTRNLTIRRLTACRNDTYGLWLDTDNRDVLIEDSELSDNLLGGLFLEANQGPILLHNCFIHGNRAGIMDGRSDNVTLNGNRIGENREAQILVTGDPAGRKFTEFDSKKDCFTRSLNWRVEGNQIFSNVPTAYLYQVAGHFPATEWPVIVAQMLAKHNTYTAPEEKAFQVRDANLSLAEWQQRYALDQDSTFVHKPTPAN